MAELRAMFAQKRSGFFYSRFKNPTVSELEDLLAKLQGTEAGIATGSGVAAISSCLISLLKAGDKIVYFIESYKPTRYLIEQILKKFQVEGIRLSIDDHKAIAKAFADPATRACIFESPTNPQLKTPDISFICEHAQKNDVLTILDNTFSGFHKNHGYTIDYYLHSLTKYANGHGDGMGGAILGSQSRINEVFLDTAELGPTLDPGAAALILRGMRTYHLRYERMEQSASAITEFLRQHPKVTEVSYPDHLPEGGGTVICLKLKMSAADSLDTFIDNLQLFKLSASLGSNKSLVAPVVYFYGGDLSAAERNQANIDESSVRLSVGIEAVEDLIADLEHGLAQI